MLNTTLALLPLAAAAQLALCQTTPVIALQNMAHTVAALEKTVPFYRDVIGLPLNGNPLAGQPQALDADMSRFTGTQGMKFRAATFRVPGASFGFELTEFTGGTRKEVRPKLQDPGSATMVLMVRDMDAMFAKLKAAGTTIVTAGGAPINPTGNGNNQTRSVVVRDPDGFPLEILRPDPLPASAASVQGEVIGASVQLAVEDMTKTVEFLKGATGFVARPGGAWGTNATVAKLINLDGAEWRITHGVIGTFPLDFGLIEYRGVPRTKLVAGAEDPGGPAFTMVVGDIDAAVAQWKSAGGTVMTTGGTAVKRANGAGNVFVRDVNGFLWELIQRAGR